VRTLIFLAPDDSAHPVPPQAFMTWKENWVFPALDTGRRVASLFHFSLRPAIGEGIFSAKLSIGGDVHRYVGRSPIPRDPTTMALLADERLSMEIVEPGRRFEIRYRSPEFVAEFVYRARFAPFDFADGPMAPGASALGDIGRSVFPYHHHEQSMRHEGRIEWLAGPRAGEVLKVDGFACRDHSWGWRDDLSFGAHHWVCASFADRFVQGSVMVEDHYPHGPKSGGWISTAAGNDPVLAVDTSGSCSLEGDGPLPELPRDLQYRVRTVGGQIATVIAHVGDDYGRLNLDARAPDRSTVYQDVQIFCDFTLGETDERGCGVIEIGKRIRSEGDAGSEGRRQAARA
jgi:hypothetical protein